MFELAKVETMALVLPPTFEAWVAAASHHELNLQNELNLHEHKEVMQVEVAMERRKSVDQD